MKGSRIALAVAVTVASVTPVLAGVNCAQVKKYLGLGRTPQDVADTMVIPLDDVKKCQAGGDAKAASSPSTPASPDTAQAAGNGKK